VTGGVLCLMLALAQVPAPLALSAGQRVQGCAVAERLASHPLVVTAIAHKESRFAVRTRGASGECGMAQVLPRVGGVRCASLEQPDVAARTAERVLRRWLRASRGDLFRAVAGYNAGYSALARDCARARRPQLCERGRRYAQDVFAILLAYERAAGLARLLGRPAR